MSHPAMILLHTGPKSSPVPLCLPAGSFGFTAAETPTFSVPVVHTTRGRRPGKDKFGNPCVPQHVRDAVNVEVGEPPPRKLPPTEHDAWRLRAKPVRMRLIAAAKAEWDADMVTHRAKLKAKQDDEHYRNASVWHPGNEEEPWHVHETLAEIMKLLVHAGRDYYAVTVPETTTETARRWAAGGFGDPPAGHKITVDHSDFTDLLRAAIRAVVLRDSTLPTTLDEALYTLGQALEPFALAGE